MAKKNLSIIPQLILLVGLFASLNSCDACKNKKASSTEQASFEIELVASKSELFPSEKSEITLAILSNDNRASSLEYSIEKLELTRGKLFLEGTDSEIAPGMKLNFGVQKLTFKPSKEGGNATINLTVVSSEGHASEAKIEVKVMDVRLDWQADTANISVHQDVPIALKLSSSYQKAQNLTYTIKEIESIKGTLLFEDSGEEVKGKDMLNYGIQKLIFKPSGELGEATIKLTVISSEGHQVSTTFRLEVKPIDFQISMQSAFKEAFADNNSVILLNILSDVEESKRLTYRVKGVKAMKGNIFFENSGEEVKLDDRLTFDIQKLIFKPSGELGEAVISLTVVSSEGEERSATLTFNVRAVGFNFKIRSAEKSIFTQQKAEIELDIKAESSWNRSELSYTIKEVETSFGSLISKLSKEQIRVGDQIKLNHLGQRLLFDPMGQSGEATITLTVVSSEGEERSATLTFNVRAVGFNFKMRSAEKSIFTQQKAEIELDIDAESSWNRSELSYTIKEVETSFGSLISKLSKEQIRVGDQIKLNHLGQRLLFDPMGQSGEATITLTVVSSEGEERSASVTINVKTVDFNFKMRSAEKNIFVSQKAEIELDISANNRTNAPKLGYIVKEVETSFGALSFKNTGKKVVAGDEIKLTSLGQKLIFNPDGHQGEATISLTVVSSEGEERSASVTINVKTVDFNFKMRPVQGHIFSHQKAIISMQSQISVQMAPELSYTVKQIKASFGSLSFKGSGKVIAPGDTMKLFSYYDEGLIFDPLKETGEATITLTVVSSEGEERSASVTIHIVPVDFDVEALASINVYTGRWPDFKYRSTVELKIIENKYDNRSLNSGPWNIISWSFSDGVKGKLMDEDKKEISALPIPFNRDREARFCIDIGAIKIDKVPKIRFLIEGAQETIRDVEVSLEKAQGMALAIKIGSYTELAKRISKQIEEFLPGGWQCKNYLASSEKIQEIRELSQKADELFNQFEKVRKELSRVDQWWKGPAIKSLIALNNAYGNIAIDDLNSLIKDILPQLLKRKVKLDDLYGMDEK